MILTRFLARPSSKLASPKVSDNLLSDVDYRLLADNLDWEAVQEMSKRSLSLSQLNKRLIIPTRDEEAAASRKAGFRGEKTKSRDSF